MEDKMSNFKITEEHRKELVEFLPNLEELCKGELIDFMMELTLVIVGEMDKDYNPTPVSERLQKIYDEINYLNSSKIN